MTIKDLIKYEMDNSGTHYYFSFNHNNIKCHFFICKYLKYDMIRLYGIYSSGVFTKYKGIIFNSKTFLERKLK